MDAQSQVRALFERALVEMKRQGALLHTEYTNQFPPSPQLRVPIRYITNRLGVSWDKNHLYSTENTLIYYRRTCDPSPLGKKILSEEERGKSRPARRHVREKARWLEIAEEAFMTSLLKTCCTPRKAARALARMDAFTRWMVDRGEGLVKARQHLMATQSEWVGRIDSRIGGIELSGEAISPKFSPDGPFCNWPLELREMMASGKKINTIKMVRELSGMGLADAKNFVEVADAILCKHTPRVVYSSLKKFQEWSH